ncbi:MAG: VOC family protein [Pseudomonadota bacterium]
MEKVTGIGGVFFRAKDPEALKAWYADNLGVDGMPVWHQDAGYTVFQPFDADTDYFPSDKQWMINFRVADLSAMIIQLEKADIAVETRAEWDSQGIGRFARIHDPEGNPVELWEPAAPTA